jgi:predicted ArsR family transcriptional regulator
VPVSRYAAIDARVLALLRERGPMTPRQIGDVLGVDREGARLSVSRLQQRRRARFAGVTDTPRSWGVSAPDSIWEAVPQERE